MRARLPALCLAVVFAGCGPFLLLPGGELDGTPAAAPADWAFTDEISTVQLETRPSDPYSVNIWAVGMGPNIYVHAGANRAEWVEHIEADANVRLRVDEAIFPLRAVRVDAQDEFDRFADAYEAKYSLRPRNENTAEAYLFRLSAR